MSDTLQTQDAFGSMPRDTADALLAAIQELKTQNEALRKDVAEMKEIDESEAAIAADTIKTLKTENAALREQNENLASLLFRVLRKLDKNDPLRGPCLDYLKKIGRTLNPFRDAIDAARKGQP